MNITLSSATTTAADVDLIALGVAGSADLAAALAPLGEFGAALASAASADDFSGSTASSVIYHSFGQIKAPRVALVGLGDGTDDDLRRAARAVGRAARGKGIDHVGLSFGALSHSQTQAVVEGFGAGNYKFDKYKAESDRKSAAGSLSLLGGTWAASSVSAREAVVLLGSSTSTTAPKAPPPAASRWSARV